MTRHESGAQSGEVDDDVQQQQRLKREGDDEQEGSSNDNQHEAEGEEDEEDLSFMPPIDELENLILEAYNNMQSDGEFIFLPDEVAQRLRQVAQMVRYAHSEEGGNVAELLGRLVVPSFFVRLLIKCVALMLLMCTWQMQGANAGMEDGGDNQQNQSDTEDNGDAISDDETGASQSTESLQESDLQEPEEEEQQQQEREQEQVTHPPAKAAPLKQPLESKFMELPPVLEIDEEGSSDSHAGSPSTEREIMSASPPPPPSSSSRRKTSSQIPLPPPPHAPVPASPLKTDTKTASSPSVPSRLRAPRADTKVASYESRREAAQKLKEDKALREQRARDSAKKQREDARRKLEEAHQRQLEEKRERVRRMRMQREGVKPVTGRKPPSSTGSSK